MVTVKLNIMEYSIFDITEEQKRQLVSTTLISGQNAWEFVLSRPQEAQPWVAKGILSCIEKGYRLDLLMVGWETRDIRRNSKQMDVVAGGDVSDVKT